MGFEADNQLTFHPPAFSDWGGHQGQSYGFGNFRLGIDEAVILEVALPACDYWVVQLGNRFWESLDWDRRQSSLNHRQATLDDDGVFRAVISVDDPGIPNWLDPAGNPSGSILGRMINPADVPTTTLIVAPVADLADHLPAGTHTSAPPSVTRRCAAVRSPHNCGRATDEPQPS